MGAINKNRKAKVLLKEQEDFALRAAMEAGLESGIATKKEKRDFELWLSQVKNSYS